MLLLFFVKKPIFLLFYEKNKKGLRSKSYKILKTKQIIILKKKHSPEKVRPSESDTPRKCQKSFGDIFNK